MTRTTMAALAIILSPLAACAHDQGHATPHGTPVDSSEADQSQADTRDAAMAAAAAEELLPQVVLKAGGHRIEAEVAATDAHRERGLMYRTSMPKHHGMLFEFETPGLYCFWMRNTLIPLTVAFMDASGRIIGFADMRPRDESSHCPPAPAHKALEMNQGWFAAHGVDVGDVIRPAD